MAEDTMELIRSYLEDTIAAEKNFESQLRQFAGEGDNQAVRRLFAQHAEETRLQHERLTLRLKELGGSPSGVAHTFGMPPGFTQAAGDASERAVRNLIMAFAVENAEVAMYEALAVACSAAGDRDTEELARTIQIQERQTADKIWKQIAGAAQASFLKMAAPPPGERVRRAG